MDKKTLVVFFSATGNTRGVAHKIAEVMGCDILELEAAEPYTKEDLDWHNEQGRCTLEMGNANLRPAIANDISGMEKYDNFIIGFPVWWYIEPRIIDTFLDSFDITGKVMKPFTTSIGADITRAQQSLMQRFSDAEWEIGRRLVDNESAVEFAKETLSGE